MAPSAWRRDKAVRLPKIPTAMALLVVLAQPALAEPRWLACKYNDTSGKPQTFQMVFDDLRGTAAILDGGGLIDGTGTTVNFQSLRTRFPAFNLTYNRNDGALAVSATGGLGGLMHGECRRSPPPPGAPQLSQ
jgi:hypothetical protein